MSAALVAGAAAGLGVAVPIGAVGTYLVTLTARTSWLTGLAAAAGVATVDGVYCAVAVLGGRAVAPVLHPILGVLRWLSVVVVLALALVTLRSALRLGGSSAGSASAGSASAGSASDGSAWVGSASAGPVSAGPGRWRVFGTFVGLTAVNPTTVIYFVAVVLGLPAVSGVAGRALFVVGAFVASLAWQSVLVGAGALVGRAVTGSRGRRASAVLSAAILLVVAVRIALG